MIKNRLITSLYTINIILCSCEIENKDARRDLIDKVITFYQNDSVASYYVERYNERDSHIGWDDYVVSNADSFPLENINSTAYLFKLPQDCSGCYNYYKVFGITSDEGQYVHFSLMEALFYQEIEKKPLSEGDDINLIEDGLNTVLDKHSAFKDMSLSNSEDKKFLLELTSLIFEKILGGKQIDSEEVFESLIDRHEKDKEEVCVEHLQAVRTRIREAIESERHFLYDYHGAIYEIVFYKKKTISYE